MENFAELLSDRQAIILSSIIIIILIIVSEIYFKSKRNKRRFAMRQVSDADSTETIYHRAKTDPLQKVRGFGFLIIITLGILLILYVNGIDVTAGLAGIGLVSTIIGLAMQDFIKDTIMGIQITSEQFFQVGDVISINGITGMVIALNIRSTKIESIENHSVYTIRNGEISSVEVISQLLDIIIPFPYDISHERSAKVVKKICGRIWMIDGIENCYYKGVYEFGASSVNYKIRCFCKPELHPDMSIVIHGIIREVFDEYGVEIPFDQLDVHIKS